ncbi:thioredoxin family protein [Chloroflexi bacterium CFX2]|nr:thioredoxin family protein [Chloroflexi bacterium CFX2]
MKIELLYFDGCPSWQSGLQNLHSALKANRLDVPVELVKVLDNDDAARRKFLGSPSFRINGVDLWDEERETYSSSCRLYVTPEGVKGSPSVTMLREAIHRVVAGEDYHSEVVQDIY